jgi:hypothetical protein
MKALRKIHYLSILLALVLTAAVVAPALATPPNFIDIVLDYTHTDVTSCEFEITHHVYGVLRGQDFFDNDGNLTRLHDIWGGVKQTWSANGKTLDVQVSGPGHFRILSDTLLIQESHGTATVITIPGHGIVYGRRGYFAVLIDYSTNPPTPIEVVTDHSTFSEDWDAICTYLAP